MNVLLVYAHPESQSLNGSLKDFTVSHLKNLGHNVQVSDLYAMKWKATFDADDFENRRNKQHFSAELESQYAFEKGLQSPDVALEQEKLLWSDTVILQFPLWWFSMPAILKGWVDRVYAYGFAYGVGEHSETRWGDRYGEGTLAGKRAMLVVTAGGWESHYSPRGINGHIDELLFPIQHGILYYPGFDVLPPFVIYRTGKIDQQKFTTICNSLGERLETLQETQPIPFYPQNKGAYTVPEMILRKDISPEQTGFASHVAKKAQI